MDFKKEINESEQEFLSKLFDLKDEYGWTWKELRDIANSELGYNFSADKYRKDSYRYMEHKITPVNLDYTNNIYDELDALTDKTIAMRTERTKLADERTQINALYKRLARENTLVEIANNIAATMDSKFILPTSSQIKSTNNEEGILLISDWHYGIAFHNIFNTYNTTIAKERMAILQEETIRRCKERNITDLTVINLGDLIAGNIHLQLRINSQIDVISQIIEVSELYAELLANLAQHFNITTYSVLDNHSRIDPNKETSLQLESLARITHWYLKERLKNCNVKIIDNTIDENIATFKVKNFNVLGVHGDLDKQSKLVERLESFTHKHFDLIVSAHMHHFSSNEQNNTMVICNGSLMGTDDYAIKLRCNSEPSQTLLIVSDKSPCEEIHRIVLS